MSIATATSVERPARKPKRGSASRLFGYDIFISFALGPPPRGTQSYGSDLARRLRERDFTVFFSEDEASPGDELDAALRSALHRSKILVVIANRGTLKEPRWVRTEVEEFRRRHRTRPVIPISVDGALEDAAIASGVQEWLGFREKIWLDETQSNVDHGIASEALVDRLALAPTRLKSNVGWRWLVRAVLGVLVILAGGLAIATKFARDSAERARTELRGAVALRLGAEAQAMLAGVRGEGDERALLQLAAADRISPGAVDGELLDALLSRSRLLRLAPYADYPCSLTFAPDGAQILVGGFDRRLLAATTGRPIAGAFAGKSGSAQSVAYSPDGRLIATGNNLNDVEVWDIRSGQTLTHTLEGHAGWVRGVAFSPDGHRLASASNDKTVRLWDPNTGKLLRAPLEGHVEAVTSVAFSPDGKRIVSGSEDKSLRMWDALTGEQIGLPLTGHEGEVTSIAFTPDGSRVLSASADGTIRQWSVSTAEAIGVPLRGHEGEVSTISVSPRGDLIVSGGVDRTLRLWDASTGQPIGTPLKGHRGRVMSAVFSPDGGRVASCSSDDPVLRIWDAQTSHSFGLLIEGHGKPVWSVAFSPDSRRLVSGGHDNTLRLWDAHDGRAAGPPVEGHGGWVSSVSFSRDGTRIVSGSSDKTVRIWDANSGKALRAPLDGHAAAVRTVALSRDGRLIASGGDDETVRLWNAESGEPVGEPFKQRGWIVSVSFSPDGSSVVSSSLNYSLSWWDTATRKSRLLTPVDGSPSPSPGVAFSPDGRYIVSGHENRTLSLWDGSTGKPLRSPLRAHAGRVLAVSFTPDSTRVVSGSEDHTLRLWAAASGQPIGPPLNGHRGAVRSVAVSPDGRRIASASDDGTLRLWPAPRSWADELCARLDRNMSRNQWREWVSQEIEYTCQCPGLPIPHDAAMPWMGPPQTCDGTPVTPMFR